MPARLPSGPSLGRTASKDLITHLYPVSSFLGVNAADIRSHMTSSVLQVVNREESRARRPRGFT